MLGDELRPDYIVLFFCGFITAGIMGFLLSRIRESRAKIGNMNRPLDSFPDAAQPGMTAIGIVSKGIGSMFSCAIWTFILIFIFVGMIYLWVHWDTLPISSVFREIFPDCCKVNY